MNDIRQILSEGNAGRHGKLTEEKLKAYLEGRLPADEQHEIERWLAEEGMESDAVEGLHDLDINDAKKTVSRLNKQLQVQLTQKSRKRKTFYKDNKWGMISICIVLVLCIAAYIVIHFLLKK